MYGMIANSYDSATKTIMVSECPVTFFKCFPLLNEGKRFIPSLRKEQWPYMPVSFRGTQSCSVKSKTLMIFLLLL